MNPVWVAFGCGCFLGCVMGVFILALVSINRCHDCNNHDDGPDGSGLPLRG